MFQLNNKIKSFHIIGLLFILKFSIILTADTHTLRGYVKNKKDGSPLESVEINITSVKDPSFRCKIESNKQGFFSKDSLNEGLFRIYVDKQGYIPIQMTVRLERIQLNILMEGMDILPSKISEDLIEKAKKKMLNGRFNEAVKHISTAIKKDPQVFILYYHRAIAYEKKGDIEKAIKDYKKSLEFQSNFMLALSALANIFVEKGEYSNGIKYFRMALDSGLVDYLALYRYGSCLINLEMIDQAKDVFEELLLIDPNYADAYFQIGIIYLGKNENTRAKKYLQKFIQLDPQHKNASIANRILHALK